MELNHNNILVKIAYLPNKIIDSWCETYQGKEEPTQINFWIFCIKLIISPVLTPFVLFSLGITFFFIFMCMIIFAGYYILAWIIGFLFTCKPSNAFDSFYEEYKKWPTIKGHRIYPAFFLLFLPIICVGLDFYYGNKLPPDTPIIITLNLLVILIVTFWKSFLIFIISIIKHLKEKAPMIELTNNSNKKGMDNNEKAKKFK